MTTTRKTTQVWKREMKGKVHKIKGIVKCIDHDMTVLEPGCSYYINEEIAKRMNSGNFSFITEQWELVP